MIELTYEYKLNESMVKKYGFTHLISSYWFGPYEDGFNKKYIESDKPNHGRYIELPLTENEIDEIINNSEYFERGIL